MPTRPLNKLAFCAAFAFQIYAAESIDVISAAGTMTMAIERQTANDEDYIEFQTSPSSPRQMVLASTHYALSNGSVVGLNSVQRRFLISRSQPATGEITRFPSRGTSLCINWDSVFEGQLAHGGDSRPTIDPMPITGVGVKDQGIEVTVQFRSSQRGVVTLNHDLSIVKAQVGEISIPIFDQPT